MTFFVMPPTRDPLTLKLKRLQRTREMLPSHGMYHVDITTGEWTAGPGTAELVVECVHQTGWGENVFLGIHAGPKVALGKACTEVGENGRGDSVFYRVHPDALELAADIQTLVNMPYGEFMFFDIAGVSDLSPYLAKLTDLEGVLSVFDAQARWAVGSGEFGFVTLASRDPTVIKRQVLSLVGRSLDALE